MGIWKAVHEDDGNSKCKQFISSNQFLIGLILGNRQLSVFIMHNTLDFCFDSIYMFNVDFEMIIVSYECVHVQRFRLTF